MHVLPGLVFFPGQGVRCGSGTAAGNEGGARGKAGGVCAYAGPPRKRIGELVNCPRTLLHMLGILVSLWLIVYLSKDL